MTSTELEIVWKEAVLAHPVNWLVEKEEHEKPQIK
jgi:hypothetical protein